VLATKRAHRRVTHNSNEDEKVIQSELLHNEASYEETGVLLASPLWLENAHTDRSNTKTTAMEYCAMLTRFSNGP
jgi:hypothetical protein